MKVAVEFTFRDVLRWILGLLLIWAAISKIGDLQTFYGSILAYDLPLPTLLLKAAAIILPWVELICGLMLLARFHIDAALILAMAMFGVFVVATGQAWARGLNISCGCFDLSLIGLDPKGDMASAVKSTWFAFLRAIALVAAAVYVWRTPQPILVAKA